MISISDPSITGCYCYAPAENTVIFDRALNYK